MPGVGEIPSPFPSIQGLNGVWLLELDLGGRVERFASRASTVPTEAGEALRFRAGLGGAAARVGPVDLGQVQRVGIQIDDKQTSWSQHLGRGGQLHHRLARLYFWFPGQTLEQALLVLEGRSSGIEYGDPESPSRLVFTLQGDTYDQVRLYPDAQAKVQAATWSNATPRIIDSTTLGNYYPTILGYPGGGDDASGNPRPAAPALMVEYNGTSGGNNGPQLILGVEPMEAAQVRLYAPEQTIPSGADVRQATVSAESTQDLLSRSVKICKFPSAGAQRPIPELGSPYWVGYRQGGSWGGGIKRDGEIVRGLGDVIEWALFTAGVEYDRERVRAEAPFLNQEFQIDTVISGQVDLVDWLSSQMARYFPIRELRSGRGLYYKLINWRATAEDKVARLVVGDGVRRVNPYRIDERQVANLFSVAYAPEQMADASRVRFLSGDPNRLPGRGTLGLDARVIGSSLLLRSQEIMARGTGRRRDGVIEAPTVDFPHTWSDSTAVNMLQWWADERALPLTRTTVEGRDLEYLSPLDVVILHDPDEYITERVALVDGIRIGGNQVRLDLTILPQRERETS